MFIDLELGSIIHNGKANNCAFKGYLFFVETVQDTARRAFALDTKLPPAQGGISTLISNRVASVNTAEEGRQALLKLTKGACDGFPTCYSPSLLRRLWPSNRRDGGLQLHRKPAASASLMLRQSSIRC